MKSPARRPRKKPALPTKRITIAAAAVKRWMSNQHVLEKVLHHAEVEKLEAMDPAHWHLQVYQRSRTGYAPTYHVRKGCAFGGSTYAASLHDPELGVTICALLNAYEATSGKDLAKAL